MTDRTAQARAEAERRWPGKMALAPVMKARFLDGVEWADANHPAVEALARVRELHRKSGTWARMPRWARETEVDAEPYRFCVECRHMWPCDTYTATEVDA